MTNWQTRLQKGRKETSALFGKIMNIDVTPEDANMIALALDEYLCNNDVNEPLATKLQELLLQFDYVANPESFLQYFAHFEFIEEREASYRRSCEKVVDKRDNLIEVDFRKE